jgi:hypothetical protein
MKSSRQSTLAGEVTRPLPGRRPTGRTVWLRTLLFAGIFLLGVVVGAVTVLFYALPIANEGQPISSSTLSSSDAIIVQVSATYIAQLVGSTIRSTGIPGTVSNVQVALIHKGPMTVTGDDELELMGVGVTKHFRLVLQPLARSCQLQVHVLHADLGGIPMTGFVAMFESQINEQLQIKPSSVPGGFKYCATNVRTEAHELIVTYSAEPE